MTSEGCLRNILIAHLDLMITRSQIYLREELVSSKLIHQLTNTRYGILILQCPPVDCLIIDAHMQSLVKISEYYFIQKPYC